MPRSIGAIRNRWPGNIITNLIYEISWGYKKIAAVEFGNNNMLIITPAYQQILRLMILKALEKVCDHAQP